MVEVKIDNTWKAASVGIVIVGQLCGFLWWATSVYMELRDARMAQQKQVQVVTDAVDKLTISIDGLANSLSDHDKRITVHDYQIKALERQNGKANQ